MRAGRACIPKFGGERRPAQGAYISRGGPSSGLVSVAAMLARGPSLVINENQLQQTHATGPPSALKAASKGLKVRAGPNGADSSGAPAADAKGKVRRALGDISNRISAGATPSAASKVAAVDGAAAELALPPVERMHPCEPAAAPLFDRSGIDIEGVADAVCSQGFMSFAPSSFGSPTGPACPRGPLSFEVGPSPRMPTSAATARRAESMPRAQAALGASSSAGTELEIELDLGKLTLVPPTPRADDGSDSEMELAD